MKSLFGEETGLNQMHIGIAFETFEGAYSMGDSIHESVTEVYITRGHIISSSRITSCETLIQSNNIVFNEILKTY